MQQTSAVRSSIASTNRRARPVRVRADPDDLGAAELLGVRDLPDGRELVLADHDAVPVAVEWQRGDERAHALRDGGRDRDVVGRRVQDACDRGTERLVALHPEVPFGAVRVPAGEPLLDRRAHGRGQRALRARVEIRRTLEDRELAADRLADGSRLVCEADIGLLGPRGWVAS